MAKAKVLEKPRPDTLPTSVVNDLATKIEVTRSECDAYIERLVAEKKATREGLPLGVLRQILTKGYTCACRVVHCLLEGK